MKLISKNVHIYKLKDIVNKYSNTYHNTIKMKPVDVKSILIKKIIKKILDLKLVTTQEYRNMNILLQKVKFQIRVKKNFCD